MYLPVPVPESRSVPFFRGVSHVCGSWGGYETNNGWERTNMASLPKVGAY